MASVHTNTYGGRTITLEVVEESWSIETNTSVVRWTLRSGTSSTYHSVYQITAWVGGTDDAHKVYGPKTADWSSRAFPCKDGSTTGTVTVQHNADGTASPLTFRLRGSVYNNNPQNYDGSIDLTTIPRATTDWSISGNTIGSNVTVTLRPNSSSFTHRVICYFGNDSQELSVASNQQSASATIKMAFCNQVPNATSGSGTMVVETYNSGQLIGSNSKPITLNVPSDVGPTTPSITTSDTAGYLSTYGAYVQGKSNLRVVTSSSGSYSSSISNVTVNIKDSNNNVLRQLSGNDVTLSSISYVGNLTIQVVVTDTRGRQASNTSPISVVEYFNPRINSFNAERRNNDSTVTITFSADICNINNNNVNSKEFRLYKRQKGTSSWGNAILTYNSAYSYSRNDFTTTCDENYGWEFLLQAQDSFTTTSNDNPEVGTAFELINWKADGTAMAIGKVSEESNMFEVALKTKIFTPTNQSVSTRIVPSNNGEASIEYVNSSETTGAVAGWGTAGNDGYGIYMHDTGANALVINRAGDTILNGRFMPSTWGTENTTDSWVPVWNDGYLYHRIIDANINKAMKSLERNVYITEGTGSGTSDWHCIGTVQCEHHSQGAFCYIKIMLGEGNNSRGNQNAWIDLYMQLGWTGDKSGIFGCYAIMNTGGTGFDWANTQLKVMTNGDTNLNYYIVIKSTTLYSVHNVFAFTPDFIRFVPESNWYSALWGNECDMLYGMLTRYLSHEFYLNKTEGNGNVSYGWCVERENTVQIEVHFNTSGGSTAVGSNVWKGTVSNVPLPVLLISGCAYYGSTAYIGTLETNGTLTIRVIGATSGQNTGDHVISMTYLRQ